MSIYADSEDFESVCGAKMSPQFGSYRTRGVSLWIKCRLIKGGL